MTYVDIELSKEVKDKALEVVSVFGKAKNIRKGVNEVTKSIERKKAKLIVIAEDVTPPEIVMHIPKLAKEKDIPYVFVESKAELGKAAGLKTPTTSIAIENLKSGESLVGELIKRLPASSKKEASKQDASQSKQKEEPKEKKEHKAHKHEEKEHKDHKDHKKKEKK